MALCRIVLLGNFCEAGVERRTDVQPTGHNGKKTSFQARGFLLDRETDSPAQNLCTKTRPNSEGIRAPREDGARVLGPPQTSSSQRRSRTPFLMTNLLSVTRRLEGLLSGAVVLSVNLSRAPQFKVCARGTTAIEIRSN